MPGDDFDLTLTPHTTYRLYREGNTVSLVTIEGGLLESPYNSQHFISKTFYTYDGAERALYGYRLLQGETLTIQERMNLIRLLRVRCAKATEMHSFSCEPRNSTLVEENTSL